jgi:hypothetical protein
LLPVQYFPSSATLVNNGLRLQLTFAQGALPDARCYSIDLTGAIPALVFGDKDCMVRSLVGDVDGSGMVDLDDSLIVKAAVTRPPVSAASNPVLDLTTGGGNLNLSDAVVARSRIGRYVVCQADGACCQPDGTCSIETASDCTIAGGNYLGNGISCDACPGPLPGACCVWRWIRIRVACPIGR